MSKFVWALASLSALVGIPLFSGAATVVDPPFPYVWVDTNGKTVGAALRLPNGEVAIELTTGRVVARVLPIDGEPTLRGEVAIYFATNDCTGSPYIRVIEPVKIAGGNMQLVTGRAGGLYSYDGSQIPIVQTVGSWLSENGCTAATGSQTVYEASLEEAAFLGQFTSPLHIEVVSGPQLAIVPALGEAGNVGLALALMAVLAALGLKRLVQAKPRP